MATLRSCSTCGLQRTMLFWSSSRAAIRCGDSLTDGLEPPLDRPRVCLEALCPGQLCCGRPEPGKAGRIAAQECGAFQEIADRRSRGEPRRARGRQNVAVHVGNDGTHDVANVGGLFAP